MSSAVAIRDATRTASEPRAAKNCSLAAGSLSSLGPEFSPQFRQPAPLYISR